MVEFNDSMGDELENAKAAIPWVTNDFLKPTAESNIVFVQVWPNEKYRFTKDS